jgi:hypothetical protein
MEAMFGFDPQFSLVGSSVHVFTDEVVVGNQRTMNLRTATALWLDSPSQLFLF